jgi:hypothetical protein
MSFEDCPVAPSAGNLRAMSEQRQCVKDAGQRVYIFIELPGVDDFAVIRLREELV